MAYVLPVYPNPALIRGVKRPDDVHRCGLAAPRRALYCEEVALFHFKRGSPQGIYHFLTKPVSLPNIFHTYDSFHQNTFCLCKPCFASHYINLRLKKCGGQFEPNQKL